MNMTQIVRGEEEVNEEQHHEDTFSTRKTGLGRKIKRYCSYYGFIDPTDDNIMKYTATSL